MYCLFINSFEKRVAYYIEPLFIRYQRAHRPLVVVLGCAEEQGLP